MPVKFNFRAGIFNFRSENDDVAILRNDQPLSTLVEHIMGFIGNFGGKLIWFYFDVIGTGWDSESTEVTIEENGGRTWLFARG
ncbi:hypothetical protein JTB14_001550 [Gonioctena quinquepunctata]|nr:hypothetical protein JTB14_001550 [Gonioctena quinquepunctata]